MREKGVLWYYPWVLSLLFLSLLLVLCFKPDSHFQVIFEWVVDSGNWASHDLIFNVVSWVVFATFWRFWGMLTWCLHALCTWIFSSSDHVILESIFHVLSVPPLLASFWWLTWWVLYEDDNEYVNSFEILLSEGICCLHSCLFHVTYCNFWYSA